VRILPARIHQQVIVCDWTRHRIREHWARRFRSLGELLDLRLMLLGDVP
jgi:hypothetical protein